MSKKNNISDIYINYVGNIKRYITHIVRKEDIDDIVQETFVKSYEADLNNEIKYARTYMLRTAKNLAINHAAKWDNKFSHQIENFDDFPSELNSQNFDKNFESKERFLHFCRATEKLSGSIKKCFILKKVYGLSQKEISELLGLSQSTVEKHVAKGLLHTAKYMEQFDNSDSHIDTELTILLDKNSKKSM